MFVYLSIYRSIYTYINIYIYIYIYSHMYKFHYGNLAAVTLTVTVRVGRPRTSLADVAGDALQLSPLTK